MSQRSFYKSQTFDLGEIAVTYSASLGSGKYTAGVMYYGRLDLPAGSVNGYLSALWSKGSGTAGHAYLALYELLPGGLTLSLLGYSADQGSASSGVIRVAMATPAAVSQVECPYACLYGGLLVKTDAGTNHIDVATSTAFAANSDAAVNSDPTTGGLGYPRALYGAGTSLTVPPSSETLSACTASGLLPWFGLD